MYVQISYLIVSSHKNLPCLNTSFKDARGDLYDQSTSFLKLKSRNNYVEVTVPKFYFPVLHNYHAQ